MTLDELVDFDLEIKEIEYAIETMSEEKQRQVDWTKLWGKKYPILTTYRQEVETGQYSRELEKMLMRLKADYGYSDEDAFLVLKDILAQIWNEKNREAAADE